MESARQYNHKAMEILKNVNYLTLATVSEEGTPWNSPLWYTYDEDYNFYFGSPKDSQHSKNIRASGKGFVVIYNSTAKPVDAFGLYFTAIITELDDVEMDRAMKVMFRESPNTKAEELLNLNLRIYKITPQEIWINDADKHGELYVDYRIPIQLR